MARKLQGREKAGIGRMTTNVALISGIDPSREAASGVFAYTIGLAKALAKNGVQVKLIGIGSPGNLQSFGVDFLAVQDHPTTSLDFVLSIAKAALSMQISKDTVIHAQRPDNLAPFCISHVRNPKVVTLHGAHSDMVRINKGDVVGQTYDQIESFSLKRAHRIICVSKANLAHFQGKYPSLSRKMRLAYAGLDLDVLKPGHKGEAKAMLDIGRDAQVILYAGRLDKEKKVDLILRAFKEVEASNERALLVIVGEGTDEGKLRNLATSLSLRKVEWRPTATRQELSILFSAADATVIASAQEGLPTIAMESLACGTLVVSTPVGIIPEIIKDGVNGYIVNDMSALSEIMEKALATSSSLSSNCAESAKRFSWESVAKEVLAVYNEASAEG
jgi:glycosyltransferase involved in cell wall biosynthesis